MMERGRLWIRVLPLTLAFALLILLPTPAKAERACGFFEFIKNTNANSTLKLNFQDVGGACVSISWRAGSGTNQDTCAVSVGWLPNGWYHLNGMYNHYSGTIVKGRAWWVSNKQCANGTWRTELFIHTEETVSQGQQCTPNPDDPHCWEGDFDYLSNGCIKLKHPGDIASAHQWWHNYVSGSHGQWEHSRLQVHN